jgi:hypothetical protein
LRRGLLEDGKLVAEGQDLCLEFGASSEAGPNRRKESRDARPHDGWTLSGATGKLNRCKLYQISGRDRRISVLKRRHGLRRCRYHGVDGTAQWVGLGVIADNLVNTAMFVNARAAA